jgi:hypothetical protein
LRRGRRNSGGEYRKDRKPISRTRSKPAIARSEFQNSRWVTANRPVIVESTPLSSQAGMSSKNGDQRASAGVS